MVLAELDKGVAQETVADRFKCGVLTVEKSRTGKLSRSRLRQLKATKSPIQGELLVAFSCLGLVLDSSPVLLDFSTVRTPHLNRSATVS